MARSTTPRSGTRRSSTTTAKKAPAKRATKAATPAASETPAAVVPSPTPAKEPAARKPAAPKTAAKAPAAAVTAPAKTTAAPKAAAKPKTVAKPKTAAKAASAPKTTTAAKPKAAAAKPAAKPATTAKPKAAAKPKTTAKSKAAAKPKAPAKPRAAPKPAATTRTAKAKAAVTGAAAAVAAKLPDVKVPKVKVPDLPEVTPKRVGVAAGLLAGIGAAVFLWRSSRSDQPDYKVVEQDGDFEIREYPATTTASTSSRGPRRAAMERNFKTLADYIFAKSRPGEKLDMTVPVTTGGSPHDGWTTRFFMPAGKAKADLPTAPDGVTLETHPARRVAAIRFNGSWDDDLLANKEGALRSWLQLKSYPHEAKAEHAAYNSPMMPGPLRRNEMLVTLSEG